MQKARQRSWMKMWIQKRRKQNKKKQAMDANAMKMNERMGIKDSGERVEYHKK